MDFKCETCYDTGVIDQAGREVYCPSCKPVVQFTITGLAHGLGFQGELYRTAVACTSSTITFRGNEIDIRLDAMRVRKEAEAMARLAGVKGRSYITSGAIAIENRIRQETKGI